MSACAQAAAILCAGRVTRWTPQRVPQTLTFLLFILWVPFAPQKMPLLSQWNTPLVLLTLLRRFPTTRYGLPLSRSFCSHSCSFPLNMPKPPQSQIVAFPRHFPLLSCLPLQDFCMGIISISCSVPIYSHLLATPAASVFFSAGLTFEATPRHGCHPVPRATGPLSALVALASHTPQ